MDQKRLERKDIEMEPDKLILSKIFTDFDWMSVWSKEPSRPVDVRMTYEDLKIIHDMAVRAHVRSGQTA